MAVEKNQPEEIMQGLTMEEVRAMYFDREALIEPSYKLYQLNGGGKRYYYRYNEDGTTEFFPSVTTILRHTMPVNPFLLDWMLGKGKEEAERYRDERAAYGTFMHAQFESLLINRCYDLDLLKESLRNYIEVNKLPDNFIFYADDLKKDMLAFAQFVRDYDVRPLAVEISLVSEKYGIAGMIDLPCTMKKSLKSDERVTAIVDFKSGRKGFWEEHEIQLHMYKLIWNENYPDNPVERVYNFSPEDWRKKPTYNFADQTDKKSAQKVEALLQIAAVDEDKDDKVFTCVSGYIALDDKDTDFSNNIIRLSLSELVKERAGKEKEQ